MLSWIVGEQVGDDGVPLHLDGEGGEGETEAGYDGLGFGGGVAGVTLEVRENGVAEGGEGGGRDLVHVVANLGVQRLGGEEGVGGLSGRVGEHCVHHLPRRGRALSKLRDKV